MGFIELNGKREHHCHQLNIIPIEVVVRNRAAGTFSKRYSVETGTTLRNVVVEWCLKDDALADGPSDEIGASTKVHEKTIVYV